MVLLWSHPADSFLPVVDCHDACVSVFYYNHDYQRVHLALMLAPANLRKSFESVDQFIYTTLHDHLILTACPIAVQPVALGNVTTTHNHLDAVCGILRSLHEFPGLSRLYVNTDFGVSSRLNANTDFGASCLHAKVAPQMILSSKD